MPGDLHTHTTFSDGSTPADKLPFLAACAGMTHLAISDHDSIRSVRYAYAHPVQNGVHLIPATELTAYDYERAHRVHLLCYWPDDCAALADFSAMMAERRLTAMLQSCKELEAICPQFRTDDPARRDGLTKNGQTQQNAPHHGDGLVRVGRRQRQMLDDLLPAHRIGDKRQQHQAVQHDKRRAQKRLLRGQLAAHAAARIDAQDHMQQQEPFRLLHASFSSFRMTSRSTYWGAALAHM